MHRLFDALRPVIRAVVRAPGAVVLGALLLSALGLYGALKLPIDTDLSKLIPQSYPSVQALERLRETVGAETTVDVGIQSPSFEANKAFAEVLIAQALDLRGRGADEPYFTRAEFFRDTEFVKNNALYFATSQELDELEAYLGAQIEQARLEANPFYFDLDEEDEDAAEADSAAARMLAAYDAIVGQEYLVSPDSTTLVVRLYPSGSQTNIGFIERLYADLDSLVAAVGPASFHPQMEVTTAGRLLRQLIEVDAIRTDVQSSFGAGVLAVLLTVVFYFFYKAYRARAGRHLRGRVLLTELARTPVMALLIGLPLLMSLSWAFGVAYLAFGALNLMTSTLGLVLFGLGIDYGIHFYARYTEERGAGRSVAEAAERTFASTGQAIAVGALSTAAALYVLVLADFRGFSEFGVIAGTGVLFALVAMTLVMPALLALFERFRLLDLEAVAERRPAARSGGRFPAARGVLLASLALVAAALVLLPRVSFEYQFGTLEPEYTAYEQRRDVIRRVFNDRNRRNPAYVVLDRPEEAEAVLEALRRHTAQDTLTPTIDRVESLQDRFPTAPAAQQAKLARIAAIRETLSDPFLEAEDSADLDRLRRAAQTTQPLALEQVPEYLRERFTDKRGQVGNFLIIYPSVGLSDARNSRAFSEDVGTITTAGGATYHAGSTALVAADMLRLMQQEAPWMVVLTFGIVALLMWINFGSLRWASLALLPLLVGVLWMLLVMEVFGMKLNFYNLVVLPAVLGIGNDAGAHLVHRYREQGAGTIRAVLRSTGEHVTMGALTTMIGFAGLLLSFHPGLNTIGALAVVGIGATLVAALVFLPALLQWREDRQAARQPEAVSP